MDVLLNELILFGVMDRMLEIGRMDGQDLLGHEGDGIRLDVSYGTGGMGLLKAEASFLLLMGLLCGILLCCFQNGSLRVHHILVLYV